MQMSQISMILCNSTSLTELKVPADEWMWKFLYYRMLFFIILYSLLYLYYLFVKMILLQKRWIACDTKIVEIWNLSVPEIVLRNVSARTRWGALVLPNPPSSSCIDYIDQFAAWGWEVRMAKERLSLDSRKWLKWRHLAYTIKCHRKLTVFITISISQFCFDWERIQLSQ